MGAFIAERIIIFFLACHELSYTHYSQHVHVNSIDTENPEHPEALITQVGSASLMFEYLIHTSIHTCKNKSCCIRCLTLISGFKVNIDINIIKFDTLCCTLTI